MKSIILSVDPQELNNDQKYLLDINTSVINRRILEDLEIRNPGTPSEIRCVTCANPILRLYAAPIKPVGTLKLLATYGVNVWSVYFYDISMTFI